ncbi:MAG: hypothetical protein VYA51_06255 [Planctomycetota bacterium]|nr:hypothetical protein [Planctomycetota bacterium]
MSYSVRFCWLACLLSAAGCTRDAEVDALVREIRADRLQRQRAADDASRRAPEAGATRAVLEGLADAQRQLAEQQVELAKELRQWTQVVATNAGERGAAEATALQTRLKALEARLEEQRARHAATEELIGRTLNQTAAQLEAFLKRMESVDATQGAGAAAAPDKGAAAPPPAGPPTRGRDERQASLWPMWTAAGMAIVAGVWLLRQPAGTPQRAPSDVRVTPSPSIATAPDAAGAQENVQELWGTAALLGEAIVKIKSNSGDPPRPGAPLDPLTEAAPDAAGGHAGDERGPLQAEQVALFVAATNHDRTRGALMSALGKDPRILSEPGPQVDARDGGLQVTFCVVPGLSGGERAALEQRVYEAAK